MKKYNGIYLMGNHPNKDKFVEGAVKALEYFDFLEVGVPFTDPVADGPVIAAAAEEVIAHGYKFSELIDSVKEIRQKAPGKDIYLMLYANIIFSKGIDEFSKICRNAGISGFIIPDVPFRERERFTSIMSRYGLKLINFITPESSEDDIEQIASVSEGFIYFVSIRGITGSSLVIGDDVKRNVAFAKKNSKVPVVLGFGVRSESDRKSAQEIADGFIMGTSMVQLLSTNGIETFSKEIDRMKFE